MTSYCVYLTVVLCVVQGLNALPSVSLRADSLLERAKREVEITPQEIERALQGVDITLKGVQVGLEGVEIGPRGLIGDIIKSAIDDGQDKVKSALERLQTRLDEAMTSVQQNFQRMQESGDEAMVKATDNLNNITVGYNEKVAAAVVNASTEAQKKCIEVAGSQGLAVIGNLAKNLVSCITNKIQEARDVVLDVISQAKRAIALIQTTPERFASCSQPDAKSLSEIIKITICIGKQVLEIQSEAFGITMAIARDAMHIQKMVTTIQTDLVTCAMQQLIQVQQDIVLAVKEVSNCIANNIANKI